MCLQQPPLNEKFPHAGREDVGRLEQLLLLNKNAVPPLRSRDALLPPAVPFLLYVDQGILESEKIWSMRATLLAVVGLFLGINNLAVYVGTAWLKVGLLFQALINKTTSVVGPMSASF